MKVLKWTLMVMMSVVFFTACSSDDDDDKVDDSGVFTGKRLTKFIYVLDEVWDEYTYTGGKLTKITDVEEPHEDIVYEISYSGNTVKIMGKYDDGKEESVYTLNEEGYAISATVIESFTRAAYTASYTFEYTDGYLTKITQKEDDKTRIMTAAYNNGDMISFTESDGIKVKCVASTIPNKGGILSPNGWFDRDYIGEDLKKAYYAGILGKHTTHLIQEDGEYEYEYRMDGEYVKSCTVRYGEWGDSDTYYYEFK